MADDEDPELGRATDAQPKGKAARISRWDRPPAPHDWRYFVGHAGRVLITLGVLTFGFVAYQLWGTGLETARAQNELDGEFERFIEDNGITPDTLGAVATTATIPSTTTTSTTTTAATVEPTVTTDPVETATTIPATTIPATTIPATTIPATAASVVQDYGSVTPGDGLFQLIIPRIGIDYNVVAGVTANDLTKGPGHFPETNLPGQYGNAAVAGHRTGHGGPFFDLDRLRPGDEIQILTRIGGAYAYIVTDSLIVAPSDYRVVTDSDPTMATLTLVTCTPKYSSSERLVVRATLDTSRGSPVGASSTFYGLDAATPVETVLPPDDTSDAPTGVPDTSGPAATTPATDATATPTTTATGTTDIVTATTTESPDPVANTNEFAAEDAFSQGWFDDGRAWPHVAGWAAALALIAFGSYRLAKRFRRLYLALVVGLVPFVVVLYFFYENVNRLLPAAI